MKLLNPASTLLFFAVFAGSACQHLNQKSLSNVAALPTCNVKPGSVHDGDTMRVLCSDTESKIRFACTDAPELSQPGGEASRNYLRSILNRANNKVTIKTVDTDKYGRTIAEVYTGDKLVQLQQVKDGMAWGYERYKNNCSQWGAIAAAEQEARTAKRGIWASNPIPPWEWRRRNK